MHAYDVGTRLSLLLFLLSGVSSEKSELQKEILGSSNISVKSISSGFINIIADKIQEKPLEKLNTQCREDLKVYLKTIMTGNVTSNVWALEMLDASSKGLHSGSLQNIWIESGGNFEECLKANNSVRGFSGQYCAVGMKRKDDKFNGVEPTLAVCLPSSCSEQELQNAFHIDLQPHLNIPSELSIRDHACHTKETDKTDSRYSLAIVLWFLLFCALSICTTCHLLLMRKGDDVKFSPLMGIFSLAKGLQDFLKVGQNPNDIKIIHVMRIIAISFVLHGHSFVTLIGGPFRNAKTYSESYLTYAIFPNNFIQTVEIFFVISWILSTIGACKDATINSDTTQIIRRIIGRIIRFQVSIAFFLYAIVPLIPLLFDGSHMHRVLSYFSYGCSGEEWKHLTFTYTIFPDSSEFPCQTVLWQFSTDMQITIFIPLIIAMLVKFPVLSWSLLSIGSGFSIAYKWYCAYYYDYYPELFPMQYNQHAHFQKAYNRLHTLAVSIFFGMKFFKDMKRRKGPSKETVRYGWTAWIIVAATQVYLNLSYISYEKPSPHPSNLFTANLLAFEKLMTPALLGWIIYVSAHGKRGITEKSFFWNCCQILSKLSFSVALLHFTVQAIIFTRFSAPYDINWALRFRRFLPQLVIHFGLGFVFHILVENPLSQAAGYLLDLFWPRKPTKRQTNVHNMKLQCLVCGEQLPYNEDDSGALIDHLNKRHSKTDVFRYLSKKRMLRKHDYVTHFQSKTCLYNIYYVARRKYRYVTNKKQFAVLWQ